MLSRADETSSLNRTSGNALRNVQVGSAHTEKVSIAVTRGASRSVFAKVNYTAGESSRQRTCTLHPSRANEKKRIGNSMRTCITVKWKHFKQTEATSGNVTWPKGIIRTKILIQLHYKSFVFDITKTCMSLSSNHIVHGWKKVMLLL